MKYGFIALMILGVWAVAAEASDNLCIESFKGYVMGAANMYDLCQVMGDCDKTVEEVKEECMTKYPDCADRAYVEAEFKRVLSVEK
jgi:hypothetical protein